MEGEAEGDLTSEMPDSPVYVFVYVFACVRACVYVWVCELCM